MSYRNGRLFGSLSVASAVTVGTAAFIVGFLHGQPAGIAAAAAQLSPQPSPVAVRSVAPGDGNGLRALVVPPPAGAQPVSVKESVYGVQTLSQFVEVQFDNDAEMAAALRARGFETAVTSAWVAGSTHGETQLIQFHDAGGAEGYVLQQEDALKQQPHLTSSYAIGAVDRGHGYVADGRHKGSLSAVLVCEVGPIVVYMAYYTTSSLDKAAENAALLRQARALAP